MKKASTIFLQSIVVLIGIGVLALLLWEPHLEGVNANKAFFEVYADPFIAFVYLGSIPFFVALYQAFKLLGYAGNNTVFSEKAVSALRTIKYCAISIIGFIAVEEVFIMLNHGDDDAAGAISLGIMMAFVSTVIAVTAALFEKHMHTAVGMKMEADLTV